MIPEEAFDKLVKDNIDKMDAYKAPDSFTNQVMQHIYLKYPSFSVASTSLRPMQIALLVLGVLLMWATVIVLFWNVIDATYLMNYVTQLITPIISNVVVKYVSIAILIHIVVVRILLFVPIITGRKISIKF